MLGIYVKAIILDDTSTVLGMESLCDDHGFPLLKEPHKASVRGVVDSRYNNRWDIPAASMVEQQARLHC